MIYIKYCLFLFSIHNLSNCIFFSILFVLFFRFGHVVTISFVPLLFLFPLDHFPKFRFQLFIPIFELNPPGLDVIYIDSFFFEIVC